MAVVKLTLSLLIFSILFLLRNYWYPHVSSLVMVIVTACISWHMSRWISRRYLLKYVMPRVDPKGKAVLVTGCDSGFGQMLAVSLNGMGFYVFAGCLNSLSSADDLISKCKRKKFIHVIQMDVTKQGDIETAYQEISGFLSQNDHQVSSLHALVNNAGIAAGSMIEWSNSSNISDYDQAMNVNFYGVVRVTRKFLPLIRASEGRIVNLTSILSRTCMTGLSQYSVSKAAAAKFNDGLVRELRHFNVKISEINPWFYKTPMLNLKFIQSHMERKWQEADEEVRNAYGERLFEETLNGSLMLVSDVRNVHQNPEDVVNAMIDAITSYEPDHVYRLIQVRHGIVFWIINDFLPNELAFYARNVIENLPKYFTPKTS